MLAHLFDCPVPPGWEFHPDEHGGGMVSAGRDAVLHVHAEEVTDPAELPNLSRMLAGFLTAHHKPVHTKELLALKLPGALGFAWQYLDGDRAVRVWIVGHDRAWAFLNFQCPVAVEPEYREVVDGVVRNFQLP